MLMVQVETLLADLVALDSVSARTNTAIIEYLERSLEGLGWRTARLPYTVAEGVEKIVALRNLQAISPKFALEWHCVGPVQSNKTRLVAEHFDWVQSVDRLKIAQRLSEQRPPELPPLQVCLQVNIDGGANKSGVAPQDLLALALEVSKLPRLRLRGLMSIPEPAIDFVAACALHQKARDLFDQINASGELPEPMDTLSIGMTADLEAAIHAGSTMVRVGTAIFGER